MVGVEGRSGTGSELSVARSFVNGRWRKEWGEVMIETLNLRGFNSALK